MIDCAQSSRFIYRLFARAGIGLDNCRPLAEAILAAFKQRAGF